MADLTQKKANFVRRYITAIESLLDQSENLLALSNEWTANAYPTGAVPEGNNITDMDLNAIAPWITAAQLNQAIGAVHSINDSIEANRGYLEAIRS